MTETAAAADNRPRAAMLALTATSAAYLLLTGLDAKSTAVLSGSLGLFGLKEVALDGLLCLGFGYAAWRLRRGRTGPRIAALVLAGAALWRGLDAALALASAAAGGDLQYWRTGQLATTGLLIVAAALAAVAVVALARRP